MAERKIPSAASMRSKQGEADWNLFKDRLVALITRSRLELGANNCRQYLNKYEIEDPDGLEECLKAFKKEGYRFDWVGTGKSNLKVEWD